MGVVIRTLLIWLLVLAVPTQGAAAATMAFCGPNHHDAVATAHMLHAPSAKPAFDVAGAQGAHDHHDAFAQASQVDQAVALSNASALGHEAASTSNGSHPDQQKCSACASCCSAGAILDTGLKIAAPAATSSVFSAVAPTVDAVAVDGPHRPPRMVLA